MARVGSKVDLERGVERVGEEAIALGRAHLVGNRSVTLHECEIGVAEEIEELVKGGAALPVRHPDDVSSACGLVSRWP